MLGITCSDPLDGLVRRRSIRTHTAVGFDSYARRLALPESLPTRDSRGSTESATGLRDAPHAHDYDAREYRLQAEHTVEREYRPHRDGPRRVQKVDCPPTTPPPPRSEG